MTNVLLCPNSKLAWAFATILKKLLLKSRDSWNRNHFVRDWNDFLQGFQNWLGFVINNLFLFDFTENFDLVDKVEFRENNSTFFKNSEIAPLKKFVNTTEK